MSGRSPSAANQYAVAGSVISRTNVTAMEQQLSRANVHQDREAAEPADPDVASHNRPAPASSAKRSGGPSHTIRACSST